MAIETEKKYRLDKRLIVELTAKLQELGATFTSERFEENYLYRGGNTEETNAVLRLRHIGDKTFLTYKERIKNESDFKTKIEHETVVSDSAEMQEIIEKLGFSLSVVYEKHRKTYHIGECEVVLDELPFGYYMEIEGEPDEILKTEKLLIAEVYEVETRGYSRLTEKYGIETDGVFESKFERSTAA